MLARLSSPTNPAAALAVITPGNISWTIGEACPSTPIPAVTFRQSTAHNSQNCGVVIASVASTCGPAAVDLARCAAAAPAGDQPGGGTRTVKTPNIMNPK